jgi:hypothetical protein
MSLPGSLDPSWLEEHLRRLEIARNEQDWQTANSIQNILRPMGVNTSLRWKNATPRRVSQKRPGDSTALWADNLRYDAGWADRHRGHFRFLSPDTLMASSLGWEDTPRLGRFKAIPRSERFEVGKVLGRNLRAQLLGMTTGDFPLLCVEKEYLDGFIAGITVGGAHMLPSFALFLVNGGDQPTQQHSMALLEAALCPSLFICFSTNLYKPSNPTLFRPLPLGVMANNKAESEMLIRKVRSASVRWDERDSRLLVAPMAMNSRARRNYVEVLSQPEFRHLVRVTTGTRLCLEEFLGELSHHKFVLSPPGAGYDCFRTWQTLAVGSIPLVMRDTKFDDRLFHESGAAFIPEASELTPTVLAALLDSLRDPAVHEDFLMLDNWRPRKNQCSSVPRRTRDSEKNLASQGKGHNDATTLQHFTCRPWMWAAFSCLFCVFVFVISL